MEATLESRMQWLKQYVINLQKQINILKQNQKVTITETGQGKMEHNTIVVVAGDLDETIIGTTGEIVDLFKKELTQQEWDALCIIHRMRLRLELGIQFNFSKSIDVKSASTSQIVDESVFLERESSICTIE